jgi:hypothetical protein
MRCTPFDRSASCDFGSVTFSVSFETGARFFRIVPGAVEGFCWAAGRRLLPLRGEAEPTHADEREHQGPAAHCWPPFGAAGFTVVMITDRFSLVRYFAATRWTSAAVTFRTLSVRVLIRFGSL